MGKRRREKEKGTKEKRKSVPPRNLPLHFETARNERGKVFSPHSPKIQQEGGRSRSPSDAGAAMTAAAAAWPVCTICYEDLRPLSDQHLHCLPACGHIFHALWSVSFLLLPSVPFRSSDGWLTQVSP